MEKRAHKNTPYNELLSGSIDTIFGGDSMADKLGTRGNISQSASVKRRAEGLPQQKVV